MSDKTNNKNVNLGSDFKKAHDAQSKQNSNHKIVTKEKLEKLEKAASLSVPHPEIFPKNAPNQKKDEQYQKELGKRIAHIKGRMNIAQETFRNDFKNANKDQNSSKTYRMDREGFNLIDKQYQKELIQVRREITEKWQQEYFKKVYLGSSKDKADARKHDKKDIKQKIEEDFGVAKKRIDSFHFGEEGRDNILKRFQEETISKERRSLQENQAKDLKKEQNQNEMLKEHGVKNVYELTRQIVQKQRNTRNKGRKR